MSTFGILVGARHSMVAMQLSVTMTLPGMICAGLGGGNGTVVGGKAVATPGCDMNWNTWWIGSRTQWNVTKDFYIGVDVMYQKLDGMSTANGLLPVGVAPVQTACNTAGTLVAGVSNGRCAVSDEDNWSVRFRVHRDFYP